MCASMKLVQPSQKAEQKVAIVAMARLTFAHPLATSALPRAIDYQIAGVSGARVAELVDAGDSKSPAERLVGSSPTSGTKAARNAGELAERQLPLVAPMIPFWL